MKIQLIRLSILFSIIVMIACGKHHEKEHEESEDHEESAADEWAQMDSFHMTMAESFHPYKDSANLEPAKKMAEQLATEAQQWQEASLPEKVNNDEMKAKLDKLKADTRAFADQVKAGAKNEDLGPSLTAIHDTFHGIMEGWHGGGEKKHEH